jgi:hypothetical protein
MKTTISRTCSATKQDHSKCQAPALPESEFCFFHDPSKAEKRREAQAQGGRQNRVKTLEDSAPDVKVEDSGDAIALISETINQVRKGQIDPRVANSVGYLANILIRAVEQNKLESRIEQLEALVKVQDPTLELNITETER